jgi:hypothetical protein
MAEFFRVENPEQMVCVVLQRTMREVETGTLDILSEFREIALALIAEPERTTPEGRMASAAAQKLKDDGLITLIEGVISELTDVLERLRGPIMTMDKLNDVADRLVKIRENVQPFVDEAEKLVEARKQMALWN